MIKSVPITLDKQRNVRIDIKAITVIERELDISIFRVNLSALRLTEIAVIMWAGLLHEDSGLTLDQALALFSDYILADDMIRAVDEAIANAFPQLKASESDAEGNENPGK